MTGGTAVILGDVGDNFGAGMTGGMAFVYDESGQFEEHVNSETVLLNRLDSAHWEGILTGLITEHAATTHSRWALTLLSNWESKRGQFWQVVPKEMIGRLEFPISDREPENILSALG